VLTGLIRFGDRNAHGSNDLMGRLKDLEEQLSALQNRRRGEFLVDEFTYPPDVQAALDFVESETKRIELEARQAACNHEYSVDIRAVSGSIDFRTCPDCGYVPSQGAASQSGGHDTRTPVLDSDKMM
jgi:hypothetical protein